MAVSGAKHNQGPTARDPMSQTSGLPRRASEGIVPFRHTQKAPPRWNDTETKAISEIPNRYDVREADGMSILRCKEAPNIGCKIDRSYSFSESDARKLGEGTILLDGAGSFAPTLDDSRHLYNLDHHSGCHRAFTLATCEQALILVLKGLELDKGDWTLYANEPDLDTVFAIWILLNYRRVRDLSPAARDFLFPLIRLEGAIDANGFEIAEACGLTQSQLVSVKEQLDSLHQIELEAKRSGEWSSSDPVEYTQKLLLEIDQLVFTGSDFSDFTSVEKEYGHVNISKDRVAVICRDSSGIYEVEKRLKSVWGDRLGIIALEKERGHYTLRRTAALAGIDLADAYERLNLLDPAVDGHPPEKRWGGSDDIGGSPRPGGTGLVPREVGKILKLSYDPARPVARMQRLLMDVLWVSGQMAVAIGLALVWRFLSGEADNALRSTVELGIFGLTAAVGAWFLTRKLSRGWTWLFGWRRPAGTDWWWLVPAVLLGSVAGGAWIPRRLDFELVPALLAVAAIGLAALGVELLFRGLSHGLLILDSRVQTVSGSWFISRPNLVSTVLFAVVTAVMASFFIAPLGWALGTTEVLLLQTSSALVTGLGLGMMRERSLSLLPCWLILWLGGVLRLLLEFWQHG